MEYELPPWSDQASWSQIRQYFDLTLRNGCDFQDVQQQADNIASKIQQIDDSLEGLGSHSCSTCLNICCIRATVWYDFRDLLFLFLHYGDIPEAQIHRSKNIGCSKLSLSGCNLQRIERPFICTWFICSRQKEILAKDEILNLQFNLSTVLKEIQADRKEMEDLFLSVVS